MKRLKRLFSRADKQKADVTPLIRQPSRPIFDSLPTLTNHFRLLRGTGARQVAGGEILEFSLETYSFAQCPQYVALSYTCGDPYGCGCHEAPAGHWTEYAGSIYVDDVPVALRRNLAQVLYWSPAWLKDQYVWVDALCINSEDLEERQAQIQQMHRIYKGANIVLAWLGMPDIHSDALRDLLEEMKGFMTRAATDMTAFCHEDPHSPAVMQYFPKGLPSAQLWRRIVQFYQRAWFTRTWILQEFALAGDLRLSCGDYWFTWNSIAALVRLLKFPPWERLYAEKINHLLASTIPQTRVHYLDDAKTLIQTPNPLDYSSTARTVLIQDTGTDNWWSVLFLLLFLTRNFATTDPADRIYALLGLMEQLAGHLDTADKLVPDYTMDVRNLYLQVAQGLVLNLPYLAVFSLIRPLQPSRFDLPSWVPDFSIQLQPFQNSLNISDSRRSRSGFSAFVCRDDDRPRSHRAVKDGVLQLEGYFVASITAIVPPVVSIGSRSSIGALSWFGKVFELLLSLQTAETDWGDKAIDALWRVVSIYCESPAPGEDDHTPSEMRECFDDFLLWHLCNGGRIDEDGFPLPRQLQGDEGTQLDHILTLIESINAAMTSKRKLPTSLDLHAYRAKMEDFIMRKDILGYSSLTTKHRGFVNVFHGIQKALFRTDSPALLGLATPSIQVGDQIFVVRGGLFPLVLFPEADEEPTATGADGGNFHYRLVGESYIHGIMYGEFVKDLQTSPEIVNIF